MKRIAITFIFLMLSCYLNMELIPNEWGFYFGIFCGVLIWGIVSLIFDYINDIE